MDIEKFLKDKMSVGWNIFIECKAVGRMYQLTYEGSAFLSDDQPDLDKKHQVMGTGYTLEELLINMFGSEMN